MKRTITFEVTYNYFEPGTLVTPTSNRCVVRPGFTYRVTECKEPRFPGDDCIVFVEGHGTGFSTEYLKEVTLLENYDPQSPPEVIGWPHMGRVNFVCPFCGKTHSVVPFKTTLFTAPCTRRHCNVTVL